MGKVAALVLITGFGVYYLAVGKTSNFKQDFVLTEKNPSNWATAFYFGLYSYDGWSALNSIVEEIKKPQRFFNQI
jgi:amino acid transporter